MSPAPSAPPWRIEVVRSSRRTRTVAARLIGDVLRVSVPAAMDPDDEARHVADLVQRMERKNRSAAVDLAARAAVLARRHSLPTPTAVSWVSNQRHRWGSCSPATGRIRISDRVSAFPPWVLDAVIVHELAHLVVAEHSPAFWALAGRYPLAERATGYLIAKGLEAPEDGTDDVEHGHG
jgi:predicted metal-dependent hydrolase